jgi:outer membrane protein
MVLLRPPKTIRTGVDAMRKPVNMFYLRSLLFWFAVLLASVSHAETGSQEKLSLQQAIEIGLKNHPGIEAQYGQVLSGEARTGQATGNYYPHFNIGSAYTRIWPVGAATSATTSLAGLPPGGYIPTRTAGTVNTYEQYAITGNLSQLLFDFGKTGAQVGVQKLNTQAARLDLQNVREQIIFDITQAYYMLLALQQNRDVALEAVEQFKKHVEYARELFEVGAKPKFDVTKAEVDLSNAEVNLIKAENGVSAARVNLRNAMGQAYGPSYAVEEDPTIRSVDQTFEEAIRMAVERRPDLLALQKQKESAREAIKVAERSHFPTVNGVASGVYVGTGFPLDHGWTAGFNMVLPLFTGYVTTYQVAEARANLVTATAKERSLKQTIVQDLEQGFIAMREAAQRIKSGETTIKQAKENLELATERYLAGLAIGVEITDAVVAYANARTAYIGAHYDHKIAGARIRKAMGGQYLTFLKK